jgi:hypothetical protein
VDFPETWVLYSNNFTPELGHHESSGWIKREEIEIPFTGNEGKKDEGPQKPNQWKMEIQLFSFSLLSPKVYNRTWDKKSPGKKICREIYQVIIKWSFMAKRINHPPEILLE